MADSITAELDATDFLATLPLLNDVMQLAVNEASHVTADAIVREAEARLRRQLGPNATGTTAAGISDWPAFNGNGFIVISEREPFPNLPLWIEKGTKKGKPGSHTERAKPYFYASVQIEAGAHNRRIVEALQAAITQTGLGE